MAVDRVLTLVDEPVTVKIVGDLGQSLIGMRLVVRVKGPAEVAQVGESSPDLKEIDKIVVVLGGTPRRRLRPLGG